MRDRRTACSALSRAVKRLRRTPTIEARLVREIRFDPDLWIVEVEDRGGRNFLDNAVSDAS